MSPWYEWSDLAPGGRDGAPVLSHRFDSTPANLRRLQPGSLRVRSTTSGLTRLVYRARGDEIDLHIRPGSPAGRLHILGRVLGQQRELSMGRVAVENVDVSVTTEMHDGGYFSVDGLSAGVYRVRVHLPHALIVLNEVDVSGGTERS